MNTPPGRQPRRRPLCSPRDTPRRTGPTPRPSGPGLLPRRPRRRLAAPGAAPRRRPGSRRPEHRRRPLGRPGLLRLGAPARRLRPAGAGTGRWLPGVRFPRMVVGPDRRPAWCGVRPGQAGKGPRAGPTGRPVFPALPLKTARMLRADLKAARAAWIAAAPSGAEREARERSDFLQYEDSSGRVADFHATRHTYVSAIVAGGASVKTAQKLARHSTPALTIGRYSHARLHDLTGALEALPSLTPDGGHGKTSACALRKTGTDDLPLAPLAASDKDLGAAKGGATGAAVTRRNMTESAEGGGMDRESQPEGDGPQVLSLPGNRTSRRPLAGVGLKYPLAESNRCSRTENPMSWATRRRGPG
mgnify:CR=1 FL=1